MTNQIATISAEINTLEAEGKALALENKKREAKASKVLKADIEAKGFLYRLGKLMFALKQESNGRIPTARLKDCGINGIDKRRRAEALWFIENESDARAFIANSKKGYSSLTALQSAMKPKAEPKPKADKPSEPTPSEPTPEQPKADEKSNVGLTASDIAREALLQCDINGIALQDFLASLKEQIVLEERQAA